MPVCLALHCVQRVHRGATLARLAPAPACQRQRRPRRPSGVARAVPLRCCVATLGREAGQAWRRERVSNGSWRGGHPASHRRARTRSLGRPCPVCRAQHRRQRSGRQGSQLGWWRRLQGRCAQGSRGPCTLRDAGRLLRCTQGACPRYGLHDRGLGQLAAGVECSLRHLVPGLHSPQARARNRGAGASLAGSQHAAVCRQLSGVVCRRSRGGGASGRGVGLRS